jgi:hypothetical protein
MSKFYNKYSKVIRIIIVGLVLLFIGIVVKDMYMENKYKIIPVVDNNTYNFKPLETNNK